MEEVLCIFLHIRQHLGTIPTPESHKLGVICSFPEFGTTSTNCSRLFRTGRNRFSGTSGKLALQNTSWSAAFDSLSATSGDSSGELEQSLRDLAINKRQNHRSVNQNLVSTIFN